MRRIAPGGDLHALLDACTVERALPGVYTAVPVEAGSAGSGNSVITGNAGRGGGSGGRCDNIAALRAKGGGRTSGFFVGGRYGFAMLPPVPGVVPALPVPVLRATILDVKVGAYAQHGGSGPSENRRELGVMCCRGTTGIPPFPPLLLPLYLPYRTPRRTQRVGSRLESINHTSFLVIVAGGRGGVGGRMLQGVGTSPLQERLGVGATGLLPLSDALRELAFQRLVQRIADDDAARHSSCRGRREAEAWGTVRTLAIIDTGPPWSGLLASCSAFPRSALPCLSLPIIPTGPLLLLPSAGPRPTAHPAPPASSGIDGNLQWGFGIVPYACRRDTSGSGFASRSLLCVARCTHCTFMHA